jgi:hypothetical protein
MTTAIALALALAANPQQKPNDPPGPVPNSGAVFDGNWSVLALEQDGRPAAAGGAATIRNGVLTLTLDGREQHWRLEPGAGSAIRALPGGPGAGSPDPAANRGNSRGSGAPATPAGGGTNTAGGQGELQGVYIATGNLLCVALDAPPTATTAPGGGQRPYVLAVVLRRQGTAGR